MTKIFRSIGLWPYSNTPCVFFCHIIPGKPKLYLGAYVDDFICFWSNPDVKKYFQTELSKLSKVNFMGTVSHYLGIKFQWRQTPHRTSVSLSQEAFSNNLIEQLVLDFESASTKPTPYRSDFPFDKVKHIPMSTNERNKMKKEIQHYVGSLLWLIQGTRPDLTVITSLLAQYQNNPSPGHIHLWNMSLNIWKEQNPWELHFIVIKNQPPPASSISILIVFDSKDSTTQSGDRKINLDQIRLGPRSPSTFLNHDQCLGI